MVLTTSQEGQEGSSARDNGQTSPMEESFEYNFQLVKAENHAQTHSSTGDVRALKCGLQDIYLA